MPMEKVSGSEVLSEDGTRIRYERNLVSLIQETRYMTVPAELDPATGQVRVLLMRMSPWMKDGKPAEDEGTLNVQWLRSRIAGALETLGHKFSFDR